jgi:hypothetical protein
VRGDEFHTLSRPERIVPNEHIVELPLDQCVTTPTFPLPSLPCSTWSKIVVPFTLTVVVVPFRKASGGQLRTLRIRPGNHPGTLVDVHGRPSQQVHVALR